MSNKTNKATRFKPGNPGGPGRPIVPDDIKEARKLTSTEVERILTQLLSMSPSELVQIKQNPKSTMLELMIHSIVVNAVNKGDQQRLDFLLQRVIGKVKEKIEMEINPFEGKSEAELKELVKQEYGLIEGSPSSKE